MATGTRYSYTDTGITKRAISDVVYMIDWVEAPLLNLFGFGQSNVGKFNLVNWPSTKAELIEDTMPSSSGVTAEALDNSETDIDVVNGDLFRQGDIIKIDLEKMLVTSVASNVVSVAGRGYGSTSAATHDTAATIYIVGRAMPESSDYVTGYTTTMTQPYNYTQIISEAAKVSKTEMAMSKYGVADTMDYHVAKLFADGGGTGVLAQRLANIFYEGERVQRSGSAYGSAGGLKTFVTTHVTSLSDVALKRDHIHAMIRDIRDDGGRVSKLITGSWGIEKINQMYEGQIRSTRDETRGGSEITMIRTPHGEVEVVYDWMCPAGDMYFVNPEKIGWIPMRDFSAGDISEQGDYFVKDVVGEYTFMVASEKSHGYITGFSTSK